VPQDSFLMITFLMIPFVGDPLKDGVKFSTNTNAAVLPLAMIQQVLASDKSPLIVARMTKGAFIQRHYLVITGYAQSPEGLLLHIFDPDCSPSDMYSNGYTYAGYAGADPDYVYGQEMYDFTLATTQAAPVPPAGILAQNTPPKETVSRSTSFTEAVRRMSAGSCQLRTCRPKTPPKLKFFVNL
jgi:hypothetical protein